MAIYVLNNNKLDREWPAEVPFPGSDAAQEHGCICPRDTRQPWPRQLLVDEDCPLHQLTQLVN